MAVKYLYTRTILLVLLLLSGGMLASPALADEAVRIGVLAYRGKAQAIARWSPMAEYLSGEVSRRFEIVPLNLDEISEAVRTRDIDFTLTAGTQ